ncbi:hypothetical protein KDA_77100 [Dictyobacter alpinus]|uniref:Haloacid dehalogenase n=1 Tax=Dictyobacter alpinus TaxID=2014873 RepID=A0A402BLM3_9CHLR|nr:hypothetical protein [Dictyobacter alpinus]GCE32226.1 hypothetical protein KDA_77100 [Dictyobacter alpinus]
MDIARIFLDIDGPLAMKNEDVLVRLYAQYLHLDIPERELADVHSVHDFQSLPAVKAFKASAGTAKYEFLLALLVFLPEHLAQADVTENAQKGVQQLVQYQPELAYCTARRGNTESWTLDVQEATRTWLGNQGFPHPQDVLFCEDPCAKLKLIAGLLVGQPEPILLIDDLKDQLIHDFYTLTHHEQALLSQHFILGAYGAQASHDGPFCVIPLPDWADVDTFLEMLSGSKEVIHHGRQERQRREEGRGYVGVH